MSEVTLLSYGGGDIGEYIVFYQDGKSEQEYFKSNTLPNQDQLQTIWNRGDQVAFIAHGKHEWCTVVRKVPADERKPNTQQLKVVPDSDFKKLDGILAAEFKGGRCMTRIVFGEDKWVLLTQAAEGNVEQKLVLSDSGFPESAISEHWDAGYFIKTSAFGNGKYALLFEKGDVPQSLYMDKEFPEEEIEDLWADCYSVSGLIYGDGRWVLISNEQTRNNHQGWVSDTLFPDDDLEELLCAGGLQPKLPPATQVQGICKTGWLMKKAPANWKPWKRRWFVLSAKKRTIYYYGLQTDEKPKGYFFTNGCTVGPCSDPAIEKKHPCTFQVGHPIRRTFFVQAPDPRTRDDWIKEIQALLDEDYDRKKTEIEKFIEDIYGESAKPSEFRELEWGVFISRMKEILEVIEEKDEDALHFVIHNLADDPAKHDTNVINTDQVAKYVSAFGFVEDAHDKMVAVANAFHGIQTEDSAEKLLQKAGGAEGTYCVWFNNQMFKVVVSYVGVKGKTMHNTISWDYSADQFFVEELVESHDLPVVFRSIESALATTEELKTPVKSNIAKLLPVFADERAAYKVREAEMIRKRQEELRKAEEAAAAAAAASGKKSKSKDKKDKKEKSKKGRRGGKKKGAGQGDDGDDGAERKGKSKGKKSKKKK